MFRQQRGEAEKGYSSASGCGYKTPQVEMIKKKSVEDCSRSEVRMEPRHGLSVLLPSTP